MISILNLLNDRRDIIDQLETSYSITMDKLSTLHQQVTNDTQLSDLSNKIQSSNQELSKLLSQVTAKLPSNIKITK